jgi:dTDP-4-amino-4,6-dideoxygalactose transaminase
MRNIPLFKVFMADSAAEATGQVLKSGYIGQGPKVDEFEKLLSGYLQTPYVNTVNSGTSGLHLILHMLKDQRMVGSPEVRDEVLTTPLTCTATNFPILAQDLKLKWVDLDPNTCNVDMQDLRRKISPRTLAIMVVHWGGYPCDLSELYDIQTQCSRMYGFIPPVIEDCAHAFGATYKGKPLGSHGNYCMFSFQAIKHLTTGDGGMITCPSDQEHKRAKLLRWYGLDRTSSADFRCEQNIQEWGYKFHMNDIAATIGIENFKEIDWILGQHRQNAQFLRNSLMFFNGVTCMESKDDRSSSDWVFTILVDRRDDFMKKMKDKGIGVSRVHDRNDKHSCLKEFRCPLPTTDLVCSRMCCIPCGWWMTPEDLDYVVDSIKEGW